VKDVGVGTLPRPIELRSVPTAAVEWRLVRATGVLSDVRKLGDRWRAELTVSGRKLPIAGLSGSGIEAAMLLEGHAATIIGIARRPYPTATDRRFAIAPRSRSDVTVGSVPAGSSGAQGSGNPGGSDAAGGPSTGSSMSNPIDADVASLGQHVGAIVRVGGLVVELLPDGLTLDDGTGVGRILLLGPAADYLPLLEPGDAINAIGRVEQQDGDFVVVVDDPAGISRVGDPIEGAAASAGPSFASEPPADPTLATVTDPLGVSVPGIVGLVSIGLVTLASVGVTLVRRHRMRRQLLAKVAARLATVGPSAAPAASRTATMTSPSGR
jgi:hypothetical protein